MKPTLVVLSFLLLLSCSQTKYSSKREVAFTKSNTKVCIFTVNSTSGDVVYGKELATQETIIHNESLEDGSRVNLSASSKDNVMEVHYNDTNGVFQEDTHILKVKKSGAAKKVIKNVSGDVSILSLICADKQD